MPRKPSISREDSESEWAKRQARPISASPGEEISPHRSAASARDYSPERSPPLPGAPWRIQLLGRLQAIRAERTVFHFGTRKAGALLGYLASYCRRPHSREALVELLWTGCDPHEGRIRLSTELTSLRRQLGSADVSEETLLLTDRATVQLNPVACTVDAEEFEVTLQAVARMSSGREQGQQLERAVELYQGELLPGYCEDWIMPERQRLAEAYLQGLGRLITHLEQAGDLHQALQRAWDAVKADPLEEEGYGHLMRLLAASGRAGGALRQYEDLSQRLAQALGVVPEIGIRDLAGQIQQLPSVDRDNSRKAQSLAWRGQAAVAQAQALQQQLAAPVADNRELRQQRAVDRAEIRELRQQLVRANQQLRAAEAPRRGADPSKPISRLPG